MFDNGYEFKRDFTTLLKDFDIKPVLTKIKNSQANTLVERLHKVILNMIITKNIDNKVFDHIYPWGETQASTEWEIRALYHRNIMFTSGQVVLGRYMLLNLTSFVE